MASIMRLNCITPAKKTLVTTSLIISSALFFSGCLSGVDNLGFSPYKVNYPQESELLLVEDIEEGAASIDVTYPEGTNTPLNMYFNGQNVSHCYDFSSTSATAAFSCMNEYIRQGENTIAINPQSLFKGTTRTFILDTDGPAPNITAVCFTANTDCTQADTGNVEVTVNYADPAAIADTSLNGISPIASYGSVREYLVPVSESYVFISQDSHGYTSTYTYKADGINIQEIAKVRIAEDMLTELIPTINKGATGLEMGTVDGSGEPILKNIKIDLGISKLGAEVYYVQMGTFDMQELSIDDDDNANLHTKLIIDPLGEENVDWVAGNGIVENVDDVGVEVLLHINDYTDCWDTWLPKWMGGGYIGTCGILGFVQADAETCEAVGHDSTCNVGKIAIDMRMYIERMQVEGDVAGKNGGEMVNNGTFSMDLIKHGTDVLKMIDVKASLTGDESSGTSKQGLIDAIIAAPAIRGMMKGIIVNVVNDNLDEIKLGTNKVFDSGAELDLSMKVEELATDKGDADNIGNLYLSMSGSFDTIKADPTIPPALGSYYVNDQPVIATPIDAGSSLGVVVNSNMVNQALLAMYNTGATHLTMLNGKMFTGLGVTDNEGVDGDMRVELNPSSPGEFYIHGTSTNQALISFRGAEMIISTLKSGTWKENARIDIDIKAGVKMDVVDGFFTMTIAGTPEYIINYMSDIDLSKSNSNNFFSLKIPGNVVEPLIKRMIEWGVPLIADTNMKLDVSKLGISDRLYTESIDSNQGHLNFDTSVKASE